MRRLFLIRHAQSEFNEKGIFQGRLDSDLTPLGFVQARLLAKALEGENIEAIISSPQRRAYKTALTLGDILHLEVEVDERIREMSFGILEGRNFWELFNEKEDMMRKWLRNPVENPLPTQEPMSEFESRLRSFLKELLDRQEDTVAVVGHGGTLHGIVCIALGLGLENLWSVHMDNTGITLLEYDGNFKLSYLNQICHLQGL